MQTRIIGSALLAAVLLTPGAALAQAPPEARSQVAPSKEVRDPDACAHARTTIGKGGVDLAKPQDKTLSEQLADSRGVICPPPNIDPEIQAPTPPGGAITVIPPPGSPGGDPTIVPK